ncbi:hypothetical protein [Terricaulis sp.]|uniref:hypothetical protein n=1 Tax=Terricaulis sp. TaxID=2768686 RepID=UPI0037836562
MRVLLVAMAMTLAACASTPSDEQVAVGDNPFPVARGSALPPPAAATSGPGRSAPPEGAGAGGLDFGRWRGADPAAYAPEFQARVRQRYAGQNAGQIRTDLEANGFLCEDEQRLDCRIEIMERQCAIDWYVVIERNRAEPVAGYEVMCLGAR